METHELFFKSLTAEEEQLIIIRDFLYDGSWDDLVQDLEARQGGKPHVFKLNSRIDEDLQRIQKLADYEAAHGIDLRTYLESSGKFPELSRAASSAEGGPFTSGGRGSVGESS